MELRGIFHVRCCPSVRSVLVSVDDGSGRSRPSTGADLAKSVMSGNHGSMIYCVPYRSRRGRIDSVHVAFRPPGESEPSHCQDHGPILRLGFLCNTFPRASLDGLR